MKQRNILENYYLHGWRLRERQRRGYRLESKFRERRVGNIYPVIEEASFVFRGKG
jgi:hypothetical protein